MRQRDKCYKYINIRKLEGKDYICLNSGIYYISNINMQTKRYKIYYLSKPFSFYIVPKVIWCVQGFIRLI